MMNYRAVASFLITALAIARPGLVLSAPVDEAAIRHVANVDKSISLYFRTADGLPISEQDFLQAASHGKPYYAVEPTYNGKLVVVSGEPVLWGASSQAGERASNVKIGQAMPEFTLVTLEGQHLSNSMFKGKLTLVDFFGYGCGPCIEEIPALNAYKVAHPEVQTLAVSPDPDIYIRDLALNKHFSWSIAANAASLFQSLDLPAVPTMVLIDDKGSVVAMKIGPIKAPTSRTVTEGSIAQWVKSSLDSSQMH